MKTSSSNLEKLDEAIRIMQYLRTGAEIISVIAPEVSPLVPLIETATDITLVLKRSFELGTYLQDLLNPEIIEQSYADALGNAKMTKRFPPRTFVQDESIAEDLEKISMWLISLKREDRMRLSEFLVQNFLHDIPGSLRPQPEDFPPEKVEKLIQKKRRAEQARHAYHWRQRKRKERKKS